MANRGPIPIAAHAASEPLLAALWLLAPFLLGFDDDTARTLAWIVGGAILLVGLTTRWRLALVKLIPLRMHQMLDLGMGAFLILAPFLFGFGDESAPTIFFIVLGAGQLLAAILTRWEPLAGVPGRPASTTR
jgi:hypothetical protein